VVPSTVSLIMIIQCAASPSPSASHFPVADPSLVDQLINPQIASPKSGGADEIVRFFTTSIETNRYCFTTWLISNQAQIYFSFFFQKNMRKIQGVRKKWHERETSKSKNDMEKQYTLFFQENSTQLIHLECRIYLSHSKIEHDRIPRA